MREAVIDPLPDSEVVGVCVGVAEGVHVSVMSLVLDVEGVTDEPVRERDADGVAESVTGTLRLVLAVGLTLAVAVGGRVCDRVTVRVVVGV